MTPNPRSSGAPTAGHQARAGGTRYQIRNALAERNKSGDTAPVTFTPFEVAYEALTTKLRPQVFSLGVLR